jgi:hypothetical protein
MNGQNVHFDADVAPLLEAGRIIPPLPDVVRARALARANASASAAVVAPPLREPARFSGGRVAALAVAASLLLAVSTAGAVAIIRALDSEPRSTVPPTSPGAALPQPAISFPQPSEAPANPLVRTRPKRVLRAPTARESYRAELHLLQQAHTAYAGHDYGDALVVVAEHARRFPNGHLAEDREALRVKALMGAGRTEEANAAARSFGRRFPRSVLLPRLVPAKE